MTFIQPDLELVLQHLDKLDENTKPQWGSMSAQRMIEHLSDTMSLAKGELEVKLEIPEDKVEKAKGFLYSEHPMPVNFKASFAPENVTLRNESIELAIDEFTISWIEFVSLFEEESGKQTLHPNFGWLNFDDWMRLNSKHLTHHFIQFGLL